MKIYVASSWRNEYYPEVVETLRKEGFEVYDFRDPSYCPGFEDLGISGEPFKWQFVDEHYADWTPEEYRENLKHPRAKRQFSNDIKAMTACDTCVLVLPCGRSAHTEAGWFAGKGKKVVAYIPQKEEPDLMYKLFDGVAVSLEDLTNQLKTLEE